MKTRIEMVLSSASPTSTPLPTLRFPGSKLKAKGNP